MTGGCSGIPEEMEQGILLGEQGILFAEQGIYVSVQGLHGLFSLVAMRS